ncbi:UDP-galactopyranose mutase [Nostoc sp. UCD121]|uniref:UDP-galactopyranose mutase n=1 Tax=unclassified Nostoc TaxID=2593658 RepID=UPI0016270549|nr:MULTISPECIES: UDP-galactopyranose mutase [unclassified Nostoc]MBC1221747.1 UDP-galactopyranose mutase [Nostoc sp. UCD120]MBC1280165.1 UDP-galactopyranose mutase [Nostoc sp. UCD121]MBC1294732.1 UDP-galactopyranose mutase [Nostoc sp. UCD122]
MTSEKSQVKNNGVSNVISPKQRKTKRSQLAETQSSSPSRLNLTSSNKKIQSTETFKDTPDIVCLSHLRWNFVYQRPQHLLSRCAQGKRVFFIEEPIFSEEPLARLDINEDSNGVVVVVPHLPQGLSEEARNADLQVLINNLFAEHNINKYICWYYTPMAIAFTRHLQPQAVVYDCMDELSAFQGASPTLKNYEAELFSRADLVFTGGQSLYESKVNQHPNVYAFPSSVDVPHFGQARNVQEPEDQAHIPHPRLGFFGVIDERMDIELLAGIAEARPDWHLVIIGPVVKIDPANLPQHENIHYLGGRDYKQLPAYLAGWDLAMLPFARNESTRFISPTKTPEYLAAGRPVVSTSIRDVVRPYGESKLVRIADTVSEFVTAAEQAMQEDTPASEWLSRVDVFLEKISWDRTWASMMKLIDSAIAARDGEDKANSTGAAGKQAPNIITRDFVFDYLVVGAGFSGSVIAERLATQGKKVLVVDKRNHIGGNAYDHYNDDGILVHKYGPHIFHTNSREVFEYLSRFTQWRSYEHRVLASVDGQLVPIPINLDTINKLYGMNLNSFEVEEFYKSLAEPVESIRTSEDVVISKVGRVLYEKFFRNYTRKQWGLDPSELDKSVIARIPTRTNRDDRYFTDTYQAMPLHGFTRMFDNMLNHPNIKVMLNTDYQEIQKAIPCREMVYSGPVDEYFDYRYGKLPYRSLDFKHETHNTSVFQSAPVINYPNEQLYTRVTEFKYLTGQEHSKTSIVYEFPKAEGDPYYPVPRSENQEIYKKYKVLADETPGIYFVGRLATYKYYNMDQCVAQALSVYKQIAVKA